MIIIFFLLCKIMLTILFLLFSFSYGFIILFFYTFQRKFMYKPDKIKDETIPAPASNIITIQPNHDTSLVGWFYFKDKTYPTVLFFHGNSGSLYDRLYKLDCFRQIPVNYLIVAYRGFHGNKGYPTENNLYHDAYVMKTWLNNKNIPDEKILLYGESLGTAVAIHLSSIHHNFQGVILESPFLSMSKMSQKQFPFLPTFLLTDKFDSEQKINLVQCPVLILHGTNDTLVPFSMGKTLYEKSSPPKFFYQNEDGHMLQFDSGIQNAITNFIQFCRKKSPTKKILHV